MEFHLFKLPFSTNKKMVTVEFEGAPLKVPYGISVAAAILGSGISHIRETEKTGEQRSPYCHMGICFECLVEIDGIENCQACLITVKEGMRIKRQLFVGTTSSEGQP